MSDLDAYWLVIIAAVVLALLPAPPRFIGRLFDGPSRAPSEAEVDELEDRGTIW